MARNRVREEAPDLTNLPPPEVRLWDVKKQGAHPTPLDQRGIVDLDELVALGKASVD
jgi:hypothetical protein